MQFGVGAIVGESVSEETGASVGEGGTGVGSGPGSVVGGFGVGPGPGSVVGGLIVGGFGVGPGPGSVVGGLIVGGLIIVGGFGVGEGPSPLSLDLLLDPLVELLLLLLLILPRLRKNSSVSAISSKSPKASWTSGDSSKYDEESTPGIGLIVEQAKTAKAAANGLLLSRCRCNTGQTTEQDEAGCCHSRRRGVHSKKYLLRMSKNQRQGSRTEEKVCQDLNCLLVGNVGVAMNRIE